MAILPILRYPDPRLRAHAAPVSALLAHPEHRPALLKLAADLAATMAAARGVGLAAPQVGAAYRVIVVDAKDGVGVRTFFDPELLSAEGPEAIVAEGCLSFPGVTEMVLRYPRVIVRYRDAEGDPQTLSAEGLLAQILQHEVEHLAATLLIDRVSSRQRRRALERAFR